MSTSAKFFVMMGVSGSGKTTIGQLLAARLGIEFLDADDYHPQANKDKMHAGIPLTDDDRWPWLHILNGLLLKHQDKGASLPAPRSSRPTATSCCRALHRSCLILSFSPDPGR